MRAHSLTGRTRRELITGAGGDAQALVPVLAAQQLLLACDERLITAPSIRAAGPATRRVLLEILAQDRAHVAATRAALRRRGGQAPPVPETLEAIDAALTPHRIIERPGQLSGPHDALGLLLGVERVAIGAAYTALASVREPGVSLLLAQTMASDAQHAALIHELIHPGEIADAIALGVVEGLN